MAVSPYSRIATVANPGELPTPTSVWWSILGKCREAGRLSEAGDLLAHTAAVLGFLAIEYDAQSALQKHFTAQVEPPLNGSEKWEFQLALGMAIEGLQTAVELMGDEQ